ncbi:hypothetical protein PI23P_09260 [Polaribacter irgensii 23-P]|uniref:Uncharacterized protein n=1 Tax=Polaribacter irgensii 23-P TaxID=313594 RepID=A4C061_9FLAO|nr:hypothetical protein PI23P_09260 [Polaribacter irgensii 23-P]
MNTTFRIKGILALFMTPVSFSPSLLDGKNLGDFSADTCRVVFSSWYILLKGVSLENNKFSSESEKEE